MRYPQSKLSAEVPRVLGVDLQADALYPGGRAVERLLVILGQIVRFGQPLIQSWAPGPAHQGRDVERRERRVVCLAPAGAEESQM